MLDAFFYCPEEKRNASLQGGGDRCRGKKRMSEKIVGDERRRRGGISTSAKAGGGMKKQKRSRSVSEAGDQKRSKGELC